MDSIDEDHYRANVREECQRRERDPEEAETDAYGCRVAKSGKVAVLLGGLDREENQWDNVVEEE